MNRYSAWRAALSAVCALLATDLSAQDSKPRHPDHEDIVFARRPQRDLMLDVYLPASTTNPPLIIYVHGGGWKRGNPKNVPVLDLLDDGIAVAGIGYRFSSEARFPAQLEDVRAAIAWLRGNAARLGFDGERMALLGLSAGGHLAMLAGCTADAQTGPIRAIVSFYGPSDFILRAQTPPANTDQPGNAIYELLGGPVLSNPDLARAASPAFQVGPDAPPLLIFHGTKDTVVLPDQSERMAAAYREAGRPVELRIKPGARHKTDDFSAPGDRNALRTFLTKHLAP